MEYNVFQNNKILKKLKDDKGWKLYNLLDVFKDDTKNALKIKKEDYLLQGKYPIVDQGQTYIGGYADIDENLYEDTPSIIFGDHTRIIKYIDFPIFIGADGVKLLKPIIDSSELNVKYTYFFLKSIELPSDGYSRHFKYLKQLIIPVPSIEIQNNIVSVLDKAQELIDKRKEQIQALDELVKSKFIEMFGDPVSNPKKWIKEKMTEVAPVVNYKGDFNEDKIWLLNLDMVESNTGRIIGYNYVKKDDIGSSTCTFDTTNVLYSKLRPYLNKVVIPKSIGYATSEMVPLQPIKTKLNRYYLTYMLRDKSFVDYISEKVAGAKMPRVSMNDFRSFEVPIPPIELQNGFEAFVKQVDKLKFEMKNSLKKLEDNFNSLMQRAFNGELFK